MSGRTNPGRKPAGERQQRQQHAEQQQQQQPPQEFGDREQHGRGEVAHGLERRAAHMEQQQSAAQPQHRGDQHRQRRRARWWRAASARTSDPASRRNWIERAEVAVQPRRSARSGIAAAAAGRGPSRGAWPRSPRSSRSAAATSPRGRPEARAASRTAARRRRAGSGCDEHRRPRAEERRDHSCIRRNGSIARRSRCRRAETAMRVSSSAIDCGSTQPLPYFV